MRTESSGNPKQTWKGLGFRRYLPVSGALLLPLILASVAIFAISCQADDPTPTPVPPAPTATTAPAPTNTPVPAATEAPQPTPTNTPVPTATKMPEPTPSAPTQESNADDQLTRDYIQAAIDFYESNGLEATRARYMTAESVANNRSLTLIDSDKNVLLVYLTIPSLAGQYVGPGSRFTSFQNLLDDATEEGRWSDARGINRTTRQEEPRRILAVLHDGLVFVSSHSALRQNVEDSTRQYVQKAIDRYDSDGLEATIAYYNSQDSLDGQFYLFLIGDDDNYLAHPIFPHLIGTDIKDVVGSDGQELGEEIAQATGDGIWVDYSDGTGIAP